MTQRRYRKNYRNNHIFITFSLSFSIIVNLFCVRVYMYMKMILSSIAVVDHLFHLVNVSVIT